MGVPFELNTMIVTKGNEIREEENIFHLMKEGYRLYPIDIPIEVRKTIDSESSGYSCHSESRMGEWKNDDYLSSYVSLNSTN